MARTSVADTLNRIRRQLRSGQRTEVNVLAEDLDTSETDVTLTNTLSSAVEVGSEVTVGIETMLVTAVNSGTKTLTVVRGWLDSNVATHATGAEVEVDPRFSALDIYEAMVDEINSWGPQLYRVDTVQLSPAAGVLTVELEAGQSTVYNVLDVRRAPYSATDTYNPWARQDFRLVRGVAADWSGAPTSGVLLRLVEPTYTGDVYVTVALPFLTSAMAYTADLVTDVKLAASMLDVLQMGVKIRLLADDLNAESSKLAQAQPRRDGETAPSIQVPQFTVELYRRRKNEEIDRLRNLYPPRMKG